MANATIRSTARRIVRGVRRRFVRRLRGPIRTMSALIARRAVPPPAPPPAASPRVAPVEPSLPPRPILREAPVSLLVGPANFAGQGWEWSRAVERLLPDVAVQNFAFGRDDAFNYPADYLVPVTTYRSAAWARDQERYVLEHFTHVLIEAGRPVLGLVHGPDCAAESRLLTEAGMGVALLAHGSDVRLPSRHAQTYRFSPFTDPDWEQVPILQARAERLGRVFAENAGPTFVSTPDLLDDVPEAHWLPVVVDPDRWTAPAEPMHRDRPLVVHAPSSTRFKGTERIEPTLTRLAERGLIDYRRISGVPNAEMPALFGQADIVLDQFVLGIYSVVSCEAMAAGRVVVAHVADRVRERVRHRTGSEVPVVEADPETLAEVIERICAERDWARGQARAGLDFVRTVHDGRYSASLLAPFLVGAPAPLGPPGPQEEARPVSAPSGSLRPAAR